MTFGIWQLWTVLALAGAVQLYLLYRIAREAGLRGSFTRRAGSVAALPQDRDRETAPPSPIAASPPLPFGKRTRQS